MFIFQKIFTNLFSSFSNKSEMEKEILEQPFVIQELLKKYTTKDGKINIEFPEKVKKIALIASGSSYHSATIAANYLRNSVGFYAQSYYSSEFCLVENMCVESDTLYIFISQSGETTDTNKALEKVLKKTEKTLAITNTKNSKLYNNSKYKMLTYAGVEKSIASTKAMLAQIFCLFLIIAKVMQLKEMPINTILSDLKSVPDNIKNAFNYREDILKYAKKLKTYENAAVLASGMFYPLSKEGALKIKETSYINTTAYPTGEFLHGHIAILNKKCATIFLINNNNIEFTVDVLSRIKNEYLSDLFIISAIPLSKSEKDVVISTNTTSDIDFLFVSLVILQLLALETASLLNRNVDSPKGLSKIVK